MTFIASEETEPDSDVVGEPIPVTLEWRWDYGTPTFILWGILGVLIFLPHFNFRGRYWSLAMPSILVGVGLTAFLYAVPEQQNRFGQVYFLIALSIAWTCVLLLSPWIVQPSRLMTIARVTGVVAATGLIALISYGTTGMSQFQTYEIVGAWIALSMCLIIPAMLSGFAFRDAEGKLTFDPAGYLLRLALWTPLFVGIASGLALILYAQSPELADRMTDPFKTILGGLRPVMFVAPMLWFFNAVLMIAVVRDRELPQRVVLLFGPRVKPPPL